MSQEQKKDPVIRYVPLGRGHSGPSGSIAYLDLFGLIPKIEAETILFNLFNKIHFSWIMILTRLIIFEFLLD